MPAVTALVLAWVLVGDALVIFIAAAPLALAMLHQAMALIVLTVATLHASRATLMPASAPAARLASGY